VLCRHGPPAQLPTGPNGGTCAAEMRATVLSDTS
jgi:hypothetical protein